MLRFALFVILNLVLFLRPTDMFQTEESSGEETAKLYEWVIIATTLASVGPLLRELRPSTLAAKPISLFVLGMLVAVVLSHLSNGQAGQAVASGVKFAKLALYYLLVVANLDTPVKFRLFLLAVGGAMAVQVTFGLLQYFGAIDLPAFKVFAQNEYNPTTGELTVLPRLCGCGIFHDPNDLCVLLAVCSVVCLSVLFDTRLGAVRLLSVIPLVAFVAAVPLTHSRGGLLALFAAFASLVVSAIGFRRGLLLLVVGGPLVLLALGGRMTRFEVENVDDTSQHRIRLWSDGLSQIPSHPLFGIGQGNYVDLAGLSAHNSYVEAFTELGGVGGFCFVSAFAYGLWTLHRCGRRAEFVAAGSLNRFRPFGTAMLVALGVGLYSLSRLYTQPTYTVFGIAAAYFGLIGERVPGLVPPLTWKLTAGLAAVAGVVPLALYLFVNSTVRWS